MPLSDIPGMMCYRCNMLQPCDCEAGLHWLGIRQEQKRDARGRFIGGWVDDDDGDDTE